MNRSQRRRCIPSAPTRRASCAIAALTALLLLAPTVIVGADLAELETAEAPQATAKQSRTLRLINYLIDKSHYRKVALDDAFSDEVLRAYLDKLDPGRNLFVRADIVEFEKLRHQFDDFIRNGALQPAFVIFDVLRIRVDQRVEYALARLRQPFDFELDEDYRFDREDAPWADDMAALDDLWRKRIKNDILALRRADKDEDEISDTLERRYTRMARSTRQFKSDEIFQMFVNAYLTAIEPHTNYFSPRASENFRINMRLSLEGIGAVLQSEDEFVKVRRIIPGGPADIARELKAEDRIVGVGQGDEAMVDIIGWPLDDVVQLIRGPKASIVRLEILPASDGADGDSKVISIRRDKIDLEDQAAKKRILKVEAGARERVIGVIDLPSFYTDFNGLHNDLPDYRSTTRDVRKLLHEFRDDGIDALVIDLRGNGGGALVEALTLTGLFIEDGPVVQVRDAGGKVKINRDPDGEIVYGGPLAVLVDGYSASASEIFAGAIQDYRRGLIIGAPTFGKGTVQHLVDLNRYAKSDSDLGQLKITISQFFRINGDSTQHRGVVPDIIWPSAEAEAEYSERAYANAIPWRQIKSAAFERFPGAPGAEVFDQLRGLHQQRIRANPEFQHRLELDRMNAALREQTTITLNQAARERERAARDTRRLGLENRMRRALGRDALVSIDALEREQEDEAKAAEADRLAQAPDALLRESGNILSDYLSLTQPIAQSHDGSLATQQGES
ncbi:MAG: carboxy terminal-processing peptidase [bacterium]